MSVPDTQRPRGVVAASFFARPAEIVATELLGKQLITLFDGIQVGGQIVEAEAYHQSEAACHGYRGRTPRTEALFGAPAHAYVYRSYGLHWCLNLVTGDDGEGSAVLIRALAPTLGLAVMRKRRGAHVQSDMQLCRGPGNVAQALGVTGAINHASLCGPHLFVLKALPEASRRERVCGPRVGISQAMALPWRFFFEGHPAVSAKKKR